LPPVGLHVPVLRRTDLELLRIAVAVLRWLREHKLVSIDERPEEEERGRRKLALVAVGPARDVAPQRRPGKRLGLPVVELWRPAASLGTRMDLFRVDSILRVKVFDLASLGLVDSVDEAVDLELGAQLGEQGEALLLTRELDEVGPLAHLSGAAGRHFEDLLFGRVESHDVELLERSGPEQTTSVALEPWHRGVWVQGWRGESVGFVACLSWLFGGSGSTLGWLFGGSSTLGAFGRVGCADHSGHLAARNGGWGSSKVYSGRGGACKRATEISLSCPEG